MRIISYVKYNFELRNEIGYTEILHLGELYKRVDYNNGNFDWDRLEIGTDGTLLTFFEYGYDLEEIYQGILRQIERSKKLDRILDEE